MSNELIGRRFINNDPKSSNYNKVCKVTHVGSDGEIIYYKKKGKTYSISFQCADFSYVEDVKEHHVPKFKKGEFVEFRNSANGYMHTVLIIGKGDSEDLFSGVVVHTTTDNKWYESDRWMKCSSHGDWLRVKQPRED